jgi:hypothetical protein
VLGFISPVGYIIFGRTIQSLWSVCGLAPGFRGDRLSRPGLLLFCLWLSSRRIIKQVVEQLLLADRIRNSQ